VRLDGIRNRRNHKPNCRSGTSRDGSAGCARGTHVRVKVPTSTKATSARPPLRNETFPNLVEPPRQTVHHTLLYVNTNSGQKASAATRTASHLPEKRSANQNCESV
jgi:hypothetical protein